MQDKNAIKMHESTLNNVILYIDWIKFCKKKSSRLTSQPESLVDRH